jgi:hypothetical protein
MMKRRSEEGIGVRQLALNSSGVSSQMNFSCKTRGFCPSCHAKRLEEWGE